MGKVFFTKYTSYGNNFVLVDETQFGVLSEIEKSIFAYQATDIHYGVGSDNFLIIQSNTKNVLKKINDIRHYWKKIPNTNNAQFIFRMFEPDGLEAFCCANGLMCIANYLNNSYKIDKATILTEIPTSVPKVISIGTNSETGQNWINLGNPRKIPIHIAKPEYVTSFDEKVDILKNIKIPFRKYDLSPFSSKQSLEITGYLVFTGEPHMVVFCDNSWSIDGLADLMFLSSGSKNSDNEKRKEFGTWLLNHIGTILNKRYRHIFPAGINVNFVQYKKSSDKLEYRCYERGIYKETLSCGTGALATVFVAYQKKMIHDENISIYPHRARWFDSDAEIIVQKANEDWILSARPIRLFNGNFLINYAKIQTMKRAKYENQFAI